MIGLPPLESFPSQPVFEEQNRNANSEADQSGQRRLETKRRKIVRRQRKNK